MKKEEFNDLIMIIEAVINVRIEQDHNRDWGAESLHLAELVADFDRSYLQE